MPDALRDFEGAPDPAEAEKRTSGPGDKYIGPLGIALLALYLMGAVVVCLYALLLLWPTPTPSGSPPPEERLGSLTNPRATSLPTDKSGAGAPAGNHIGIGEIQKTSKTPDSSEVVVFGLRFTIADEVRLLLIVMLAGALGSLVHGIRSFYWYIGNRELIWSWLGKYLIQPFAGTALAVVFYLVVRGGFFSPQAGFKQTSPFGFAALAALVGLFSEQAVLKLKEVAETILAKPNRGKDTAPPQDPTTS